MYKEEKVRQLKGIGEFEIWKVYDEKCYDVILDDDIVNVFRTLKEAQNWAKMMSE